MKRGEAAFKAGRRPSWSVVGRLWEEWLSAVDNIKQLYTDKNPSRCLSTCPEWSQFHIVSHCSRNLSQRRTSKTARVLIQRRQQLNTCLRESVEWEDGRGFYLGATQIQITHQITPIMIKAQEWHLTFPYWSLGTLSASSTCMSTERGRERENGWGRPYPIQSSRWAPIQRGTPALLSF